MELPEDIPGNRTFDDIASNAAEEKGIEANSDIPDGH